MSVGDLLIDTAGIDPAWQDLACVSFDSSLEPIQGMRAEPGRARVLIFTAAALSLELR